MGSGLVDGVQGWRLLGVGVVALLGLELLPLSGLTRLLTFLLGRSALPPCSRGPSSGQDPLCGLVGTCCDHFPSRRPQCVCHRPRRLRPTEAVYDHGFLEMFSEFVFAE